MSDSYVFLGRMLSEADARAELDAVYLPPVCAGDICRLWSRRPRLIGIIDGYLEPGPAMWHKEILWIMERGAHVFGSAGAGALRAAELDAFGMRGVGWVYQAFRDGTLDQDDEVAIGRGTATDGYRPQSVAMVNIRRTLQAAEQQNIVSGGTRQILTAAARALFYRERTWPRLLGAGRTSGADPAELRTLDEWLPSGQIDQQADDARAMLREMHSFLATDPPPQQVIWTVANTATWVAAKHWAESTQASNTGPTPG